MSTGLLHVAPPSVDFETFIVAVVPPQSPAGPVATQRCHVTYTVPSWAMARSLNWSTVGLNWVLVTGTRVKVAPPSQEWATVIRVWVNEELKSVYEAYRQFWNGLV